MKRYYFISYTGTSNGCLVNGSCSFTSEGGHVQQKDIIAYINREGAANPVINNIIEMTEQDWRDYFDKN